MTSTVLTLNAGSSSLKYGLYPLADRGAVGPAMLRGKVEALPAESGGGSGQAHAQALAQVLQQLKAQAPADHCVVAVGHRIVHGGTRFVAPCRLDEPVMQALAELSPLAPLHQPHNLEGVRAAASAFAGVPQIGAFDTAFHATQSAVQRHFALPPPWFDQGVQRYGFHGLSYEAIAAQLRRREPGLLQGRLVVAHLGSGASMCGLLAGRSVATTMGFSALDGLTMGTRCGRIDPGVLLYLMDDRGMDSAALTDLLYRQSGLRGLSTDAHTDGLPGSGDMRELLAREDPAAHLAIDHFVETALRELAGLAAAMRGLDGIVFTGGVGENAAPIRERIAQGAAWLGARLDPEANADHRTDIGSADSRVALRVLPTDEESVIAAQVAAVLAASSQQGGQGG